MKNYWFTRFFYRLKTKFSESTAAIEPQYLAFVIFSLINFTLPYLLDDEFPPELDNIHWFGLGLTTLLIIAANLPKKYQAYGKFYWYCTVTYCLVFFADSLLIFTYAASYSILNMLLSLFLLIVLTNWLMALMLFIIGGLLAALYATLVPTVNVGWDFYLRGINLLTAHYYMTFYFLWALLVATFFLRQIDRKKENLRLKRQLNLTQVIASSIAHELRTPLLTISATIEGLKQFTPYLIESYQIAKQEKLPIPEIPQPFYQALKNSLHSAAEEVIVTNTIINILLVRLRGTYVDEREKEKFLISEIVNTALERYPFDNQAQRLLITVNPAEDFYCEGIKLLLIHVIFNLLKNALYFIQKAQKGSITIWLKQATKYNYLYFKDTGTGINKKHLPFIFDEFYSATENGSGVGLAFCKLVLTKLGGDIKVNSVENEYTLFTLQFPILKPT